MRKRDDIPATARHREEFLPISPDADYHRRDCDAVQQLSAIHRPWLALRPELNVACRKGFERKSSTSKYMVGVCLQLACTRLVATPAVAIELGAPSPLLAIDRNRATVVDRIVNQWGPSLATLVGGVAPAQLREMLQAMRSDQLLAASLAGSLEGLRRTLAGSLPAELAPRRP